MSLMVTSSSRVCSITGCRQAVSRRTFCQKHYYRWRVNGDPLLTRLPGFPPKPPEQRFWPKVKVAGITQCWIWQGAKTPLGYGVFNLGGRPPKIIFAHRFSFQNRYGLIPRGKELDHLCRTPACVNPNHLEAVDHQTNMLRGHNPPSREARQTHCIHGHPFDLINTYYRPNGRRECKICAQARYLRYKKARGTWDT